MDGITTGTRLDRLQRLQRAARLQRQLAARQRRPTGQYDDLLDRLRAEITREQRARPTVANGVRTTDQTVQQRLDDLGVTAYTIKVWAIAHGLIPTMYAGRISRTVIEAYATAHPHQETP